MTDQNRIYIGHLIKQEVARLRRQRILQNVLDLSITAAALTLSVYGSYIILSKPSRNSPPPQQNAPISTNALSEVIEKEYKIGPKTDKKITFSMKRDEYLIFRNEHRDSSSERDLRFYRMQDDRLDAIAETVLHAPTEFFELGQKGAIADYERIFQFIAANTTYQADGVIGYAKYPFETLVDGGGDCEDHAILAATLLRKTGRSVGMITEPGHVTLAIGLKADEELPSFVEQTLDSEILSIFVKNHPEKISTGLERIGEFCPSAIKKTERVYAAQIVHKNRKYFAVETTAKKPPYIKTTLDKTATFTYIY